MHSKITPCTLVKIITHSRLPKKQQEDLQGLDAAEGVEGAVLDGLDVVVVERPAGEQERPIITQGKKTYNRWSACACTVQTL